MTIKVTPRDRSDAIRTRGRRWMRIRERILTRDPCCVLCWSVGVTSISVVVDHVQPLAQGGTDDEDNLRGLCLNCHAQVTGEQFGHRKRTVFGTDGLPQDGGWF